MGGWTGGRQAVGGWWIAKPQWSHTACLHHFPSSILQFSRTGLLSTHKQKLWAFQKSEHDSRTCWPVQQKDRDPKKSSGAEGIWLSAGFRSQRSTTVICFIFFIANDRNTKCFNKKNKITWLSWPKDSAMCDLRPPTPSQIQNSRYAFKFLNSLSPSPDDVSSHLVSFVGSNPHA